MDLAGIVTQFARYKVIIVEQYMMQRFVNLCKTGYKT
jgi:hypothetical protein